MLRKDMRCIITALRFSTSREYKKVFRSADRGAIWARRLELERSCGAEAEALAEARAMLEAEKAVEGVNPYRFHALKL